MYLCIIIFFFPLPFKVFFVFIEGIRTVKIGFLNRVIPIIFVSTGETVLTASEIVRVVSLIFIIREISEQTRLKFDLQCPDALSRKTV